jgi:hypothetical protein
LGGLAAFVLGAGVFILFPTLGLIEALAGIWVLTTLRSTLRNRSPLAHISATRERRRGCGGRIAVAKHDAADEGGSHGADDGYVKTWHGHRENREGPMEDSSRGGDGIQGHDAENHQSKGDRSNGGSPFPRADEVHDGNHRGRRNQGNQERSVQPPDETPTV